MRTLDQVISFLRFRGLGGIANIQRNTMARDRLNRIFRRQHPTLEALAAMPPQLIGDLEDTSPLPNGCLFKFANAALEVLFLAPDIARLAWQPGTSPVPYALARSEWPEVAITTTSIENGWRMASPEIAIVIEKDGSVSFFNSEGKLLRAELPPFRQGESWTHQARLAASEHLYGLGEQGGPFNLRGSTHRLWNTDPGGSYGAHKDPLYMPIPLYLGLHASGCYLVFYENYHPGIAALGSSQPWGAAAAPHPYLAEMRFETGQLRYYFIPGPPCRALERYTELTGRAPLPPLWSLGYHQCRWGYKNETDIRQVAAGFKTLNLPISAIHLDIDYMQGYRIFTVDEERFPNLADLSQEMLSQGIHLVTIVDPAVKMDLDYDVYTDGLKERAFCTLPDGQVTAGIVWPEWAVFPDFTNPATRAWWGEWYPRLLKAGIAGFWHDMNEPSSFTASDDLTLPLATQHNLDGQGGDHRAGHNLYALQMNRAGFEALQKYLPERRPWIISRAGWASQQRYAWNWTGDTESSWAGLRMTIATVLGMGISGLPFTGPDIGGFSGSPTAELYLRSFQMAAFLPFFRTHSSLGTAPREPWVFGEPYTAIIRQFLQLRYRLLPYLYSLAWEASQRGQPMIRPLFWEQTEAPELWDIADAFLVGDDLLVAPILEEGATGRPVYLPVGEWYSFWDAVKYTGGGLAHLECGLERIPVFVRAGAIIPTTADGHLLLHVYPPLEDTQGRTRQVFSDAGDGYGEGRVDRFTLSRLGQTLLIDWQSEGTYPLPYSQVELHLHAAQIRQAAADNNPIACQAQQVVLPGCKQLSLEIAA